MFLWQKMNEPMGESALIPFKEWCASGARRIGIVLTAHTAELQGFIYLFIHSFVRSFIRLDRDSDQ